MGYGVVEKKRLGFWDKVWFGKRMVSFVVEVWYNGDSMEEIKGQLREIILNLYGVEILAEVSVAPEGQKDASGRKIDYATNVAMRLAGQLKRKPKEIAEEIKE